jgi:hypothetical protein
VKRPLGSSQSLWYLILAASVVVFGIGAYRFLNRPPAESTPYGERVQRLSLEDSAGRSVVSEPGGWRAFLIANPTDDISVIRALRTAVEDRGRDGQPVHATVFAREDAAHAKSVPESLAPLTVVPFSRNAEVLSRDLRVQTTDRQLFLVDPKGQVAFHGTHPRYSDVRLLFDRYIPLRRPQGEHPPLRIGDTMADIPLTTLKPAGSAGRPERLWIVFTSRCTACALNTHADVVGSVQKSVARFAEGRESGAALVFAPSFDNTQVREKMDSLNMTLPVYVAASDIPTIERAAETAEADVVVIERDAANRVTRLEPLSVFVQELREKSE